MTMRSHYPSFNVMNEQDAWDDHTQSIVASRLNTAPTYQFLTQLEVAILESVCSILLDDGRKDIIKFVIHHIDDTLQSSIGESQRKVGVPEASILVRTGLKGLEESSYFTFSLSFLHLKPAGQIEILQQISESRAEPISAWMNASQQPFFQKILSLAVEAYCSHPSVWSGMGYAGPAYPRGYVRGDIGQLDPWEAQPE